MSKYLTFAAKETQNSRLGKDLHSESSSTDHQLNSSNNLNQSNLHQLDVTSYLRKSNRMGSFSFKSANESVTESIEANHREFLNQTMRMRRRSSLVPKNIQEFSVNLDDYIKSDESNHTESSTDSFLKDVSYNEDYFAPSSLLEISKRRESKVKISSPKDIDNPNVDSSEQISDDALNNTDAVEKRRGSKLLRRQSVLKEQIQEIPTNDNVQESNTPVNKYARAVSYLVAAKKKKTKSKKKRKNNSETSESSESSESSTESSELSAEPVKKNFQKETTDNLSSKPTRKGVIQISTKLKKKLPQSFIRPKLSLTESQADLLGTVTGEFRGTGDAYRRFLLGNNRIGVQKAINAAELLVDASVSPQKYRKTFLPIINRIAKKEASRKQIMAKVNHLDELRIYIVTRTYSLSSFYERLQKLKRENEALKRLYYKGYTRLNDKIAAMATMNEELDKTIVKVEKLRKEERLKLVKLWDEFVVDSDDTVQKKRIELNNVQFKLDELQKDLWNLHEFRKLAIQGPAALNAKYEEERHKIFEMNGKHDLAVAEIQEKYKQEDSESSKLILEKVTQIIEDAHLKISNFTNQKTQRAYSKNEKLKREIGIHKTQQSMIQKEIDKLLNGNEKLKKLEKDLQDPRRRVLNLKKCMTCEPDSEF